MTNIIHDPQKVEQNSFIDTGTETLARAREVVDLWESVLDSPRGLLILTGKNAVEKSEQHNTLPWIMLSAAKAVTTGSESVVYGRVGFIDSKDTLEMYASFSGKDLLQHDFEDLGLNIILDYFRLHVGSTRA